MTHWKGSRPMIISNVRAKELKLVCSLLLARLGGGQGLRVLRLHFGNDNASAPKPSVLSRLSGLLGPPPPPPRRYFAKNAWHRRTRRRTLLWAVAAASSTRTAAVR
jgi:hypothetical protein